MAKSVALQNVEIASGQTKGGLTLDQQRTLLAVMIPAAFTGTSISFEAATDSDGSAYYPVYEGATLYSVNVGTSRYVALNTSVFTGVKLLKIVSGSAEGANRTLIAVTGEVT